MSPVLNLGSVAALEGPRGSRSRVAAEHLVTQGVVVGMTGSGKTGLVTVLIEEAARAGVPTVVIDVKGDLPNLLLAFPDFDPARLQDWVERDHDAMSPDEVAARAQELGQKRRAALASGKLAKPS